MLGGDRCGEMRTIIGLMIERVARSEAKLIVGGSSGEDGNGGKKKKGLVATHTLVERQSYWSGEVWFFCVASSYV